MNQEGFATYGLIIVLTMVLIIWQGVSREVAVANASIADEVVYREGYYRSEGAVVLLLAQVQDGEDLKSVYMDRPFYRDDPWTYYYRALDIRHKNKFRLELTVKKDGDFHQSYRHVTLRREQDPEEGREYFHIVQFK